MKKINIVFMGTPPIAVSMLKRLLDDGHHVIGVVTQPDKKVGRKQTIAMSLVKQCALEHAIPVFQPLRIKEDYEALMQLPMDLLVTCAYGQFVPTRLLEYPTYGSINVHASLLPKLRGGAPIHKAVMLGDKFTGMSIMRMVQKMDAGDVMAQCQVAIEPDDTTGDLYDKLAVAGADLLSESVQKLIEGTACFIPQEEEEATFAYTIQKEEEFISFHRDVEAVYNHIRGLIPFPVGHGFIHGKKVKFHKARMLQQAHTHALGEVLGLMQEGYAVAARNGIILVDEIQMEGKSKVSAKDFYNGVGKQYIKDTFD